MGGGGHHSHLSVSHRGLGVSVSGGGRVGPIFWWRVSIGGGLVEGLLRQGGHRHQGISLVLLIHLERLGLRKVQSHHLTWEGSLCLSWRGLTRTSLLLLFKHYTQMHKKVCDWKLICFSGGCLKNKQMRSLSVRFMGFSCVRNQKSVSNLFYCWSYVSKN